MAGFSKLMLKVAVGYGVVAVFAVGYAAARRFDPDLGTIGHAWAGVILAAPLVMALIWDRVTRFRFAGVEVELSAASLEQVTVGGAEVEELIAESQAATGNKALEKFAARILSADFRVFEIDLHDVPYWWFTRLYLVAAILVEFTRTKRIVFLGGCGRYVGMCEPVQLRDALENAKPGLHTAYEKVKAKSKNAQFSTLNVHDVVKAWIYHAFETTSGELKSEIDLGPTDLVGIGRLKEILGVKLETGKVRRPKTEGPILNYLILENGKRYVPLVTDDQFECVVDAEALARKFSVESLEKYFSR